MALRRRLAQHMPPGRRRVLGALLVLGGVALWVGGALPSIRALGAHAVVIGGALVAAGLALIFTSV